MKKKKDELAAKDSKKAKALEEFKKRKEVLLPSLVADISKGWLLHLQ